MVQSRPPEKRTARLVSDAGAERSLDGRILQTRSRRELRKRDSSDKMESESRVRLVGTSSGSVLFMRGKGKGCEKRLVYSMPHI